MSDAKRAGKKSTMVFIVSECDRIEYGGKANDVNVDEDCHIDDGSRRIERKVDGPKKEGVRLGIGLCCAGY